MLENGSLLGISTAWDSVYLGVMQNLTIPDSVNQKMAANFENRTLHHGDNLDFLAI